MLTIDTRSNILGALPISDSVFNVVLAAGVAQTLKLDQFPADATHCLIGCNKSALFVRANGTAAIPGANVVDGSGSVVDPVFLDLRKNTASLSFIHAEAAVVSLQFFKSA